MFGSPETTSGGKALKYYASVRIDIRRIQSIAGGTDPVGIRVRTKIVKNKVAPPFRTAEFDMLFSEGISREGSLIDVGVELGVVKKSGSWYEYSGEKLGQGKEAARQTLKDNKKMANEIDKKIRAEIEKKEEIPMKVGLGEAKTTTTTSEKSADEDE